MDFDLNKSGSKLRQEQERRKAEAARKAERERKAQEEAKRQKAILEEALRLKRIEDEARAAAEIIRQEEEMRLTAGITYNQDLLAYDVEGEGDKVTLPTSALEELTKQDALSKGPMLFRLTLADGKTVTHAGVLEFVADEGTVGLPPKVRRSLGKMGEESLGHIKVKYVRLEKGTYVKMVPRNAGLSQVPLLKAMLERNLIKHATLSVGDVLQVWHRGKPFDLKVVELQPEPYTTVIDTDIEVDLDVPEDQQQAEADAMATSMSSQGSPDRAALGNTLGASGGAKLGGVSNSPPKVGQSLGSTLGGSAAGRTTGAAAMSQEVEMSAADRARPEALASTLPPEPEPTDPEVITCLIRRPDGKQATRRFLRSTVLQALFDFVVSNGGVTGAAPFSLVTRFPRRVFTSLEHGQATFEQAGLTGKQEAFMVEVGSS